MAEAFQKPPFQANAFQEGPSFSVDAFQKCAFQNPGYQTSICPNPTQDGRSAYWRLFFYNLQEESLKRDQEKKDREQKQGQKASEGTSEATRKATPAVSKPKQTPRREPREAVPVVTELKVRPRPIYQPQPQPFDVAPWLAMLNTEFKAWNLSAQTLHGMLKQKQAANEEEETLTLLLLAA